MHLRLLVMLGMKRSWRWIHGEPVDLALMHNGMQASAKGCKTLVLGVPALQELCGTLLCLPRLL